MFRSSGGPETLNKPILGNKNYGERLVLCYIYNDNKKGYDLTWALSGDNNYIDKNRLDITNHKLIEGNISDLSQTLRVDTPTTSERGSIESTYNLETPPSVENAIRLGGKRQKKSRTTRRKSRTSGGKRRSRRAKRAIMVRHK